MSNIGFKSSHRKKTMQHHVKQCAYCNANYTSARITSKYCSSSCRANAWNNRKQQDTRIMNSSSERNSTGNKKDAPTMQMEELITFFQEFYTKLLALHKNFTPALKEDESTYIYELQCGYITTAEILQELITRLRYKLSLDDYREICFHKYEGVTAEKETPITYADVIRYLHKQ